MLLGRAKISPARTVLVLDVENGSVASALVRISPDDKPKLFGERRITLPLTQSVSGADLSQRVEGAVEQALRYASEVASRLRVHPKAAPLGHIDHAAVFLSPPWGMPNLASGTPDFAESMSAALRSYVGAIMDVPVRLYTATGAALRGLHALHEGPYLLANITGEATELLLVDETPIGHASLPTGLHAVLRTLRSHGGLSESESRSALMLPFGTARLREPFRAAANEFGSHFAGAAQELLALSPATQVRVLSPSAGEWFAQALSDDALVHELFPRGGEVRALHARHVAPYVAAHAAIPDTRLILQALFVDTA